MGDGSNILYLALLFAATVLQIVAAAGTPTINRSLVIAGACLTSSVACAHVLLNKSALIRANALPNLSVIEIASDATLKLRKEHAAACLRIMPAASTCVVALPKSLEGTVFTIQNISLFPLGIKAAAFTTAPEPGPNDCIGPQSAASFVSSAGKYTRIGSPTKNAAVQV